MAESLKPTGTMPVHGKLNVAEQVGPIISDPVLQARLADLHDDYDSFKESVAQLQGTIRDDNLSSYSDMALHGESIKAAARSSAESDATQMMASVNKIGNYVAKSVVSDIGSIKSNLAGTTVTTDYPPWEQALYSNLQPSDAYRVSQTMRAQPDMSSSDLAVQAAQVITGGENSRQGQHLITENGKATSLIGDNPPDDQRTIPCDDASHLPVCDAYGAVGWCRLSSDDAAHYLWGIPHLTYNLDQNILPNDQEVLNARIAGAMDMLQVGSRDPNRPIAWEGINANGLTPPEMCPENPNTPPPLPPPPATNDTTTTGTCPPPEDVPNCPVLLAPGTIVMIPWMDDGEMVYPPYPPYPPTPPVPPAPPVPPIVVDVEFPEDDTPPPPPPPPAPTQPKITTPCTSLDDVNVACLNLQQLVEFWRSGNYAKKAGTRQDDQTTGNDSWLSQVIGWSFGNTLGIGFDNVTQFVRTAIANIVNETVDIATGQNQGCDCDPATYASISAALMIPKFAEEWLGYETKGLFLNAEYARNSACAQEIIGQAELDDLYVKGEIPKDAYTCYTKAHGHLPKLHTMVAESSRVKPGVNDIIKLFRSDEIEDEEYKERMHGLGVMRDEDRHLIEKAWEYVPSVPQLIRWMTRDVADDEVVADQDLYAEFDAKYKDDVEDYFNANGYTRNNALNDWAAHWIYPGNETVFQFLHRLRPGRVEDDLVFNEEDASKLLAVNDVAPKMRERLIAVSYNVPTRIDLRRGYFIDALDDKDVIEGLQDVGYDKDGAELLLNVYDADKEIYQQNQKARLSSWTPKTIARAYGNGTVSEHEAKQELDLLGVDEDKWETILQSGETLARSNSRKACIRQIRKSYMIGARTKEDMESDLFVLGMSRDVSSNMANQFACERGASVKQTGAALNIRWYVDKIISLQTLTTRLNNLNYSTDDVDDYIAQAMNDDMIKRQKEQDALIAKAKREEKERQAAVDRQEKKLKDAQKAIDAANKGKKS